MLNDATAYGVGVFNFLVEKDPSVLAKDGVVFGLFLFIVRDCSSFSNHELLHVYVVSSSLAMSVIQTA